ncbi:hypothetical protein BDY21DRAFT_387817 [Lineolata rhizophorae]|uniref:TPR-like protein n=1 Tax=Lineolata rhizophorae TaxID=578093 RepID=A0A6A6NQC3_9PEZI|nr:hypothetical protein BDY21DRAFT_387817 [Lineolata rhizophorae]
MPSLTTTATASSTASTNPSIASHLRHLVYYHLDNEAAHNAHFFATRLQALEPRSADAAHLVALCSLRLGHLRAAYDTAKDRIAVVVVGGSGIKGGGQQAQQQWHMGCAYVFAQACLALELFSEGITALERAARGGWVGQRSGFYKHSETTRRHLPDAPAVNCLLGKLWRAHGDVHKAVDYYVDALKENPFIWDAFQDLCDMGVDVRASNVFRMSPELAAAAGLTSRASSPTIGGAGGAQAPRQGHHGSIATPGNDPFSSTSRTGSDLGLNPGGSNLLSRLNETTTRYLDIETPSGNGIKPQQHDEDVLMGDAVPAVEGEPPTAPMRRPTRAVQAISSSDQTAVDAPRMRPITTRSRLKTGSETADAPEPNRTLPVPTHKRTISGHAPTHNSSTTGSASTTASTADASSSTAPQRRSARLFSQIRAPGSTKLATSGNSTRDIAAADSAKDKRELRKVRATGTKGSRSAASSTSTVGRVVSGNRKLHEPGDRDGKEAGSRPPSVASGATTQHQVMEPQPDPREREALAWLVELFSKLGAGYYHLSRHQSREALQAFSSITPPAQRDTAWVLAQMGRAYHDGFANVEAAECFARVRKIEPARLGDLEVYSTVLWMLKRDVELAFLAHELSDQDRLAPQTWIAVGNSFSLQREHAQAISCFRRATQLDGRFAYAFTLTGHEHFQNEEYERAMAAYRLAVAADARHYNGWYGLGRVFEKMGKLDAAEVHYNAAARLHPRHAVLALCVGDVLCKMGRPQSALTKYALACELDARNRFAHFKRARVLMTLRRGREALAELLVLKDQVPDEANVHFMLGRAYKMLKEPAVALRHYTIAMNLDPKRYGWLKASHYVKEAMENLNEEDDEDLYDDEGV